jgi:hypothetical protein
MSKGSAGKVYFVLYLAVILELLIIIVERDEAEESLHKRQKESMRIVQNILSQLQTGSGSANMNVSPNDLIIIQDKATVAALPKDQQIKRQKTYSVKVSVTDVSGAKPPAEGEVDEEVAKQDVSLTKLGNVQDLTYQLFYSEVRKGETQESAPFMPTDDEYRKEKGMRVSDLKKGAVVTSKDGKAWELMDVRKLDLQVKETKEANKTTGGWLKPLYKLSLNEQVVAETMPDPPNLKDTTFYYDHKKTVDDSSKNEGIKVRAFTVNFDPGEDGKPGWYKLRFFSSTNRILGIDGGMTRDMSDEDQINVGVVKLKVKALKTVKHELVKELDGKIEIRDRWYDGSGGVVGLDKAVTEFNDVIKKAKETYKGNDELLEKITLYDYIEKLLTPGFSSYLDQNRGVMDIDVEVRKPDAQQAPPQISDLQQPKVITFDKLQVTKISFTVRPASYFKPGTNPIVEIKPSIPGGVTPRIDVAQTQLAANLAPGDAAVAAANQPKRLYIIFDKPVPAGDYTVKLSYTGGGKTDTASTLLKVLPSQLEAKAMKTLGNLKFAYGKRVTFRSKLPPEAELPLQQFAIDYTLGNERTVADNPYSETFTGPYIPASAKKVKVQVVWKYPETGERVVLWSKDPEPEQQAPDIVANNPIVDKKSDGKDVPKLGKGGGGGKKPVQPDNFQITVRGITVDYEVPIDADNKDPNNSKKVNATLDNVEPLGDAEIDYSNADTQLRVYNGDEPDPTSTWQVGGNTFYVVSGAYNEGSFPLTIQVKDLPPKPKNEQRTLRGTVAVKVGAKIRNNKAGKSSAPASTTVVIPVNIPYN